MIKADLINKLAKEMNISRQEAETGVNLFFQTIKEAMAVFVFVREGLDQEETLERAIQSTCRPKKFFILNPANC